MCAHFDIKLDVIQGSKDQTIDCVLKNNQINEDGRAEVLDYYFLTKMPVY